MRHEKGFVFLLLTFTHSSASAIHLSPYGSGQWTDFSCPLQNKTFVAGKHICDHRLARVTVCAVLKPDERSHART
ncbi:uncharacterized [Tachysurus ichikawai]